MSLDLGLWPLMFWVLSVPKHAFNKTIWPLKESKIIPMANSHRLNQVKRVIKVFRQHQFDGFGLGALLVVPISWRLHEWDDLKWCMLELKKKIGKAELVEYSVSSVW